MCIVFHVCEQSPVQQPRFSNRTRPFSFRTRLWPLYIYIHVCKCYTHMHSQCIYIYIAICNMWPSISRINRCWEISCRLFKSHFPCPFVLDNDSSVSTGHVSQPIDLFAWFCQECLDYLILGFANVAFRSTNYNEQSSRAHCILTLTVQQQLGDRVRESKVRLVDLAGNERWAPRR